MPLNNIDKINLSNLNKKTIQIPIDNNFICLRSLNPNRSRFEVEYSLEKGSCTNSFLIQYTNNETTDLKSYILIHPPGLTFEKEFLEVLDTLIDDSSSEIKLVMGHINPNKVAFIKKFSDKYLIIFWM